MDAETLYRPSLPVGCRSAASGRMDSSSLSVLVVDSQPSSRREVTGLLRECSYQVTEAKSTKEVLGLLAPRGTGQRPLSFDIVLKEHEPPRSNACRLLREFIQNDGLKSTPVVVYSSQDDRERVIECLQLGACDYLVKPLRQNELRNLWTRVWRQVTPALATLDSPQAPRTSSQESEGTKCDEDDEPASKEGSAPGQEGCGSKEGNGNSGDKDGYGNRYQSTGVVSANSPMGSCRQQDGSDKNANGGSNGNGASTTLKPDRHGALLGTAEGGKPAPVHSLAGEVDRREDNRTISRPTPIRYAPVEQLVGVKRSASEMAGSDAPGSACPPQAARMRQMLNNDGMQTRSANAPGSTSCHVSEDTYHASETRNSGQAVPRPLPPGLPPQLAGLLFPMQSGPRPPPQCEGRWPAGLGTVGPPPSVQRASGSPELPWSDAAMMQYLLGPFSPAHAQLMLQIQLLSEKSGVPPHILLQQVLADSSQLLGLLPHGPPTPVPQSAPAPSGQPPAASPFPPGLRPTGVPGLPLTDPVPGGWKNANNMTRQQQETAQQRQNAIMVELVRQQQQQQQQQAALLMQSMQLWGLMGCPTGLGQNPNETWPSGVMHPPLFPPMMAPVSVPDSSVMVSVGRKVDSKATVLDRKDKPSVTDPRKKRRQAALDKYREKRKNLNSSNTIRYPGRRELAQLRPRSHGQFVSYKREEENEPQETRTNGRSKPVEDAEEMADGGTSWAPGEGDVCIQSADGEEVNAEEEVNGACAGSNARQVAHDVQATGGDVSQNVVPPSLGQQPYCMLPIGIPGMNPRLFPPGGMPFQKLQGGSLPEGTTGNNGRNSSDSGSNCPDMQVQDK